MNKKIKCSNCGNILKKDSKFCPFCGTKVEEPKIDLVEEKDVLKKKSTPKKIIEVKPELIEKQKTNTDDILIKKNINYNKIPLIIITIFITLLVCFIITILIINCYSIGDESNNSSTVGNTNKTVTITDTGIADSVLKVYDSVVIVKAYKNNQLYSIGTGFVYEKDSKNGYILTNNHVVDEATKIEVVFTNEKVVATELVGKDTYSDIAVLKVDKDSVLSVASIGSSETLRVGDTTFAVGAPIDADTYSWTVTRGILSGKNREVEVSLSNNLNSNNSVVMEVLQTDTPINSGNSGGPLCNSNGEVIGITNMKLSSTTIEGIGFAIPIETAIEYANKIVNGEDLNRPYLGVGVYYVSPTLYSDIDVSGIYVSTIEENSTAKKVGLKVGDIITKIDDVNITSAAQFKYQLYKYEIGDTITLTYFRNNKEKEVRVKLINTTSNSN